MTQPLNGLSGCLDAQIYSQLPISIGAAYVVVAITTQLSGEVRRAALHQSRS